MNKYQWPSTKLTEEDMAILYEEKQKTGRKICDLLRDAVRIAYGERDIDENDM